MPIDRGTIDQQLNALGETRWWDCRELRDLPAILNPSEEILSITRGKVGRIRFARRSYLIVATNRRLLAIRSSARSWRQIEMKADQITRASLRVGPFRGRVVVIAAGQKYKLLVPKTDAYRLSAALSSVMPPGQQYLHGFAPTRIARRLVDHVMALPAVVFEPRQPVKQVLPAAPPPDGSAERVEFLEAQVDQLQQQVEFLEELLRRRGDTGQA